MQKGTEEYRAYHRVAKNRFYHKHRLAIRARRRETAYGLPPGGYEKLLIAHGGRCAICRGSGTAKGRGMHVDHDHACCPESAKSCGFCIRGILCDKCNTGLGKFKDSPLLLRLAAEYLERFKR